MLDKDRGKRFAAKEAMWISEPCSEHSSMGLCHIDGTCEPT